MIAIASFFFLYFPHFEEGPVDARHHHLLGRLLKPYWNVHLIVIDLHPLLYLFGDGSHADKRGTKNPVGQKGRISQHHPCFCFVDGAWDGYACRWVLPIFQSPDHIF